MSLLLLLCTLTGFADPAAQRSPVDGDLAVSVGAPTQAVAWRIDDDAQVRTTLSLSTRLPSAATDLSIGLSTHHGPERGWGWAAGTSMGVVALRGPSAGLSVAPWARLERRGTVHGGVQVAAPIAADLAGTARLPILGELFIGSRRDRVHVVALGGAGWAFVPSTPAGSLVVHGTIQVGITLGTE